MAHWLEKVITLLQADTADLRELARIAGGNPKTFYRGVKLDDLDLKGQNLEGMEFSDHLPPHDITDDQLTFDLPWSLYNLNPASIAQKIRSARRQEERATLLLAEFLRDRSLGMQIVESYAYDKAQLTHSVLKTLSEIRSKEISGKHFSNLQIARKVSGRFGKAEDKRSVLVYFFAKYLHSDPEIRKWLRGKSIHKLGGARQQEIAQFLKDPPL